VWSFLTVILLIAGGILMPISMGLSLLSFAGAFLSGGKAYAAHRDLESFMGLLVIVAFLGIMGAVLEKLW
jgi:hypothetical protein